MPAEDRYDTMPCYSLQLRLNVDSPSSLGTHIEALLSTGIRLQTHKDSSCRYTRPRLQASLTVQPATSCQP